jgi:magnesium-transporting ATPase (P-type)
MDPGWLVLFLFLIFEGVIVLVLILPMPTNTMRGAVIGALTSIWNSNSFVRYMCFALVALDTYYFGTTYRSLYYYAPAQVGAGNRVEECERKIAFFREQRNLYITGVSIYLFFIMWGLFHVQTLLHQSRQRIKVLESEKKET